MPYKDFTVGQVLTSAEVDNFLMRQAVMVFDDATDRSTSLGTVITEGMLTFLKDSDSLEYYSGIAFESVAAPLLTEGTAGYLLVSNGTVGSFWVDNGTPGQNIVSAGTAGVVAENSISPLLLLGV